MTQRLSFFLLLAALWAVGCTQNQVQTPTRVLDRPSDVALFCVDYDLLNNQQTDTPADCGLPLRKPYGGDDQSFLNDYCNAPAVALPTDLTQCDLPIGQRAAGVYCQKATVLAPEECDGNHRGQHVDTQLAEVRAAAANLGLDPNNPCCPLDNTTCGILPQVCSQRRLMALVTNTTRGELAVIDTQAVVAGLNTVGQIQNLQSGKPGFGFLPVGLLPEHVRTYPGPRQTDSNPTRTTAPHGWAVTSNAGSCDLASVDLNQVVDLVVRPRSCSGTSCPERIRPYTVDPAVPLSARPSWVEPLPWKGDVRHAMVAFPACGLVADVDLKSGRLSEAITFDGQGRPSLVSDLSTVRCPAECGGGGVGLMPDVPDGGLSAAGTYPSSIAVYLDPDHPRANSILIGDGRLNNMTMVPFDPDAADGHHLTGPPQLKQLANPLPRFRAGDLGIDVVRVGPSTRAGTFAYLVAHDATIRVYNLDPDAGGECETNPDARYLQELAIAGPGRVLPDELYQLTDDTTSNNYNVNARRLTCLPVGQTPRSPLAYSPGIALSGGALPRDVAFVHIDEPCDPSDVTCVYSLNTSSTWLEASPLVWLGDYAWILGSDGTVQAVQISDYCPQPSYRACFPEQAALRRVALLQTRSAALPSGPSNGLPALPQAVTLSPQERMGNVARRIADRTSSASPILSRFDDVDPGPRVVTDSQQQAFTARVAGTAITVSAVNPAPAPQSFYYLPVDPVCDLALADAATTSVPQYRPSTIAAFPDPLAVRDENWSLAWEGVLNSLSRTTGRLLGDGTLIDVNGQYCNRGVEPGDKVWLPGCTTNADCPNGLCVFEQSLGGQTGICLSGLDQGDTCHRLTQPLTLDRPLADTNGVVWAASWVRRYRVVKALQGQDKTYPITPVPSTGPTTVTEKVDQLVLAEIAEPEFEIAQVRCDGMNVGDKCDDNQAAVHEVVAGQTNLVQKSTYCHADVDRNNQPVKRCVLQCYKSSDCGVGFVCAHSRYELQFEGGPATSPNPDPKGAAAQPMVPCGRCLRAPIIAAGTPTGLAGSQTMAADEATRIVTQCFPDQTGYEVRGGDAFVVSGDVSHAPVLETVAQSGECQRPSATDGKELFQAARLFQPRLRPGPRVVSDKTLRPDLPVCSGQFISHRIPGPAPSSASCRTAITFLNTGQQVLTPPAALASTTFPKVVTASTVAPDPWLQMEDQLFGSLPLSQGNACILDPQPETLVSGMCPDMSAPPCSRRVHYENTVVNLVMAMPRYTALVQAEGCTKDADCAPLGAGATCNQTTTNCVSQTEWTAPQEGYVITFTVSGGSSPYYLPAAVPNGQQAQGLRSAAAAPDGSVFMVDQGRSVSPTGLRGQLLRLVGSSLDNSFLVR